MVFVCPDSHSHAEVCYSRHGCRCGQCKQWRRDSYAETADFYKQKRHMAGHDVCVPAWPTIRRLRALACLGWSSAQIADRIGFSEIHVSRTRRGVNGDDVRVSFATAVDKTYRALCMQKRDTHHGRKTMTIARKNGWLPPLAYDDIDNPHEQPKGAA